MSRKLRQAFIRAFPVFAVITVLNFLVFVAIAWHLGGDAVNGKAEAGRFYLHGVRVENGVKVYTEVSERVFNYSRWHVYSIFITWPLLMAGGIAERLLAKRSQVADTN